MYSIIEIKEGLRFFKRAIQVKSKGFKEYPGDDVAICKAIIEDCWNDEKGYFQVSAGHFCEFYSRDFSWCVKSLLTLGHRKRAVSTIRYALDRFREHGHIRVAINPEGKPFDFPKYAVDSLPSIVHTLRILNNKRLISDYSEFISQEVNFFFKKVIDTSTGMVRIDRVFSSIQDHAQRKGSCYDNCMVAMLSNDLDHLGLKNPFKHFDYPELLKKHFWNKTYFLDDLSGRTSVNADANVFPFWTGVINDKKMFAMAFETLRMEKLDKPFPLKYHQKGQEGKLGFASTLAPDYETDSIWCHIGMLLMGIIDEKRYARKYMGMYFEHIVKHKTFLEVYDRNGEPYRSKFYITDEGMLWSSMYLALLKKF